jgi:hypothetical protein
MFSHFGVILELDSGSGIFGVALTVNGGANGSVRISYNLFKSTSTFSWWNGLTRCRPTANGKKELRMMIYELRKYKIAIAAIQETRWTKSTHRSLQAMDITAAR